MPQELKDRLQKAADLNGRSLNMEICQRLAASLEAAPYATAGLRAQEAPAGYAAPMSDLDKQLLAIFQRMPVDKQLALISLFK